MKRTVGIPIGVVVAGLFPAVAFAQTEPRRRRAPPPNVVTFNPVAAILGGTIYVEYERAVHPSVSLFVGPQVQVGLGILGAGSSASAWGFGLALGARFYLSDDAPRGFFLSPQFEAASVSVSSGSARATGVGYGGAALAGYQWLVSNRFAISLGLGVRYYELEASSGRRTLSSLDGFGLAARASFGFAFGGDARDVTAEREAVEAPREGGQCRFPVDRVQVCASSQGYRFAIPYGGTCAPGSTPLDVVALTCEARDRPAYHACLDAAQNWIPVVSWETCGSHGWTDAPGDYVPPGRAPAEGVAPGPRRVTPPAPAAAPSDAPTATPSDAATPPPPDAPTAAPDSGLPSRETVRAALLEIQLRAAECLPPGAFQMRITFGNDGVAREVVSLSEPLPDAVIGCFLAHARAVRLPPFARDQLVVTQRFTPRHGVVPPPPPR